MAKRSNGEGTKVLLHATGRYYAQVSVGGKRLTVYGDTKAEVIAKRTDLLAKANRGQLTAPEKITLGEWLDRWLDLKRPHVSARTAELYADTLRLYVPGNLRAQRLQGVKRAHIKALEGTLAAQGLSVSSRSKVFQHLRSAFEEAIEQELIALNPARSIRVKATVADEAARERATDKALSEGEMLHFLDVATGDPLYPLLYLMFSLGVRRGEALGLRWRDVDFTSGEVRIEQQVKVVGHQATVGPLKTAKSRRTLYAAPDLLDVLAARRAGQAEDRRTLGAGWTELGLVFTTSLGTIVHPRNVNRTIDRLCRKAGVRHFGSHAARHTVITARLRDGEKIEVVAASAGHTQTTTTTLYRTVFEDERRASTFSIAERRSKRSRADA